MHIPPTELAYVSVFVLLVELLGILTAIDAIMGARTSQGSIAWAICLVTFPYVSLPMYWVFGRNKFRGYVKARRREIKSFNPKLAEMARDARKYHLLLDHKQPAHHVWESLARLPFLQKNDLRLLIDGPRTFDAIFAGIREARDYVLVQFFIVKDDRLGNDFKAELVAKARQGVRVLFLYDEIGCHKLSRSYVRELKKAGVVVQPFHSTRGFRNRFQLNFRNHRKIVIVDGETCFVGGLNVGDEYMGRSRKFGHWRDTHVRMAGPAVNAVQLSFVEDWNWATGEVPELNWTFATPENGDQDVLVLPTGPADQRDNCGLMFVQAINVAAKRFWLASPYFVPDEQVISALQLAALRGVDVRIVLPEKPDHLLVYLSAFSYLDETVSSGVKLYRYRKGFLHHKVFLIDDRWAAVGTANLDNRSFRLNFEITLIADNRKFAGEVEEMFLNDFAECEKAKPEDLKLRSFWFRLAVRLARLTAPIQ